MINCDELVGAKTLFLDLTEKCAEEIKEELSKKTHIQDVYFLGEGWFYVQSLKRLSDKQLDTLEKLGFYLHNYHTFPKYVEDGKKWVHEHSFWSRLVEE